MAIAVTLDPEPSSPPAPQAADPSLPVASTQPSDEAAEPPAQAAPTATESPKVYIAKLDAEIKQADAVLISGNLKDKSNQSVRFNALADEGKQFGETVFAKPYGYCFGAGLMARAWWQARLFGNGADMAWKDYRSHRKACLEASPK